MNIYLPIAEIAVSVEAILLLGVVVGFLSGVFGVGGGFLTTPFLIFMGIPPAIAVGSQTNQLVAAGVAGVLGHWRRGNVDIKIGLVMLIGGVLGSAVGILIFTLLRHLGQIDFAVPFLYIVLLGSIGLVMLAEMFWSQVKKKNFRTEFNIHHGPKFIARLPYKMRFPRSRLYISALVPGGIGFAGGLLAAIMGVGGAFMLVPAMIYILGMSTIMAAGTSLFQIIFTTAAATMMHATVSQTVDLILALFLIVGSVIGVQLGINAGRSIRGSHARLILAVLVLSVSVKLAIDLFIEPSDLFTTSVWGQ